MALYQPIIDESRAMQTGSGSIVVYYTCPGTTKPTSFGVAAIDPRTGADVRTSSTDINYSSNGYITVPLKTGTTIAQVSLIAKKTGETSSIPSKAVIFKLFNETITLDQSTTNTTITTSPYTLNAGVNFAGTDGAADSLAWYRVTLKNGTTILAKTEKLYPQVKNIINATLDYDFLCSSIGSYSFDITICSTNGIIKDYTINNLTNSLQLTNATAAKTSYNSSGITASWAGLTAKNSYTPKLWHFYGGQWKVKTTGTSFTVADNATTGSSSFVLGNRAYKYRITLHNSSGAIVQATNIFWHSAYGDDILLQDTSKSYLIKYNPEVTSFKRNITDVITPTLGGKYPYTYRNGHQNYRTFTIGGLIARYNTANDVTYYGTNEELVQERLYREELLDFLYNDKVKLFSSVQEGEMLIKLSGVSLTPMKQLGRMLYSFTATATEVADCTAENLKAYGIEG